MHIERGWSKRKRLSLTPLIDVIFLLLLFFMLSSTFTRFSQVEIKSGSSSLGTITKPDAILMLHAETAILNGDPITKETLPSRLDDLVESGAKSLVIAVSKDVSSQYFVNLLHVVSQSPLTVSVARN